LRVPVFWGEEGEAEVGLPDGVQLLKSERGGRAVIDAESFSRRSGNVEARDCA